MAWKDVEVSDEERAGSFFKFDAIGTKLLGRFVKTVPQTGQYAKPGRVDYVFKVKDAAGNLTEVTVSSSPVDLSAKLTKARLKPGYAVKIEYVKAIPSDDPSKSAQKIFKVSVDDSPAPAAAAKPPPPPPPPSPSDDIPF